MFDNTISLSPPLKLYNIKNERQYRQRHYAYRMAGIRTSALVCIVACLFVMFSILDNTYDRTRIAAQVASGIGFPCGGVILKEGVNIRALNTAATICCTASIGVLVSE